MAAPSTGTVGTFGSKATLASSSLTSGASNIKVVGINLGGSVQDNEFKDGVGTVLGLLASSAKKTCSLDIVYAGSDMAEPAQYEVVTISLASDARANGKWIKTGMIQRGFTENGFAKYTLTLEQHLSDDCSTISIPSQS